MESRKYVLRQTLTVLAGNLALSAVMTALFALFGHSGPSVLLGAAAGSAIAALNFFAMALGAEMAANKAQQQDIKGGQALLSLSYGLRLAGIFLILVICAKTEIFDLVALVLPLAFTRPVLTIAEIFRKKGGAAYESER